MDTKTAELQAPRRPRASAVFASLPLEAAPDFPPCSRDSNASLYLRRNFLRPSPIRPSSAIYAPWLRSATTAAPADACAKSSTCFRRATSATASSPSAKTRPFCLSSFATDSTRAPDSKDTVSAIYFLRPSLPSPTISPRQCAFRRKSSPLAATFIPPRPRTLNSKP